MSPHSLDADLLAFDLRVFGYEPSIAWDRYVTPHTTEWFAFFYFGYFFLLSAHVLPIMLLGRNRLRVAHFALGIFMVFCTGHLLYMVVPGWGPYHHLAGQFEHPLEGGLFWRLVRATVDAGGAQKDIFPSLHTARRRTSRSTRSSTGGRFPFRFTWPFMAFAATQIIIATMFLRWHYLIDIFAGLTLATTAALRQPPDRRLGDRTARTAGPTADFHAPRLAADFRRAGGDPKDRGRGRRRVAKRRHPWPDSC